MGMRRVLAAGAVLLCGAGPVSAQTVSLEFHNGRVRLIAENAPVSRILAEWARLGGTRIVNAERIPGGPVTLQLLDVPERQALDVVLRGAAGYMLAARATSTPTGSVFDRVLVLPTTSRAPSTAAQPPPAAARQALALPLPTDDQIEADADPPFVAPTAQPVRIPPGRVQTGLNLPVVSPDQEPEDDGPAPNTPGASTPGNPFGIVPGTARPGVITPPPPPRRPANVAR